MSHGQNKQTNKQTKNPQNIKQKQYCNKFNKDFKNGPHQHKKEEGVEITNVSTQLDADPGQPLFWVFLAMLGALV